MKINDNFILPNSNWTSLNMILTAIIAALGLLLSFPIFDFWMFSFLSYAIYIYIFIKLSDEKSHKNLMNFFIFTSFFWFLKRSIEFESIYHTAANYFQNTPKGIIFTIILFGLLAVYSGITNVLAFLIVRHFRNPFWRKILIIISMILISNLNNIYLPLPPELVMFQNKYIMASLNFFPRLFFQFIFYISALSIISSGNSLFAFVKRASAIAAVLIVIGCIGFYIIEKKEKNKLPFNVVLIQTNQSSLVNNFDNTIDSYLETLGKSIDNKYSPGSDVYFYWPESFMEEKEENFAKINSFQHKYKFHQFHFIGTYKITDEGITNKLMFVDSSGKITDEYIKNVLFPIGEKSINLPFLPSAWTKVNIPVLNSENVNSFNLPDLNILPLICYESVQNYHYERLHKLADPKKMNLFLNASKDSFYEGTSLIKLHSIYARMKASEYGTPMIRISTTENTEVISSTGEILTRAKPHRVEVISVNALY
ncbi:MAG: hypothetical protein H7177_06880 [Rhizobacter sp.]|nr:hypothetical protein [Bacteriovorax sp.]